MRDSECKTKNHTAEAEQMMKIKYFIFFTIYSATYLHDNFFHITTHTFLFAIVSNREQKRSGGIGIGGRCMCVRQSHRIANRFTIWLNGTLSHRVTVHRAQSIGSIKTGFVLKQCSLTVRKYEINIGYNIIYIERDVISRGLNEIANRQPTKLKKPEKQNISEISSVFFHQQTHTHTHRTTFNYRQP